MLSPYRATEPPDINIHSCFVRTSLQGNHHRHRWTENTHRSTLPEYRSLSSNQNHFTAESCSKPQSCLPGPKWQGTGSCCTHRNWECDSKSAQVTEDNQDDDVGEVYNFMTNRFGPKRENCPQYTINRNQVWLTAILGARNRQSEFICMPLFRLRPSAYIFGSIMMGFSAFDSGKKGLCSDVLLLANLGCAVECCSATCCK